MPIPETVQIDLNAFPCDRVLAETDGTGPAGTKREYIWLGDMPVAVIDKSVTPNKTYMVHADHLNRPYFMTDSTKAEVWKAIYEPFGTVYSTTGAAAQTHRFPGQWFQIESGLAYNWHRHYDATLGRYVSADPLGLVDGPSVYGYVGQAPLEGIDETGLFAPALWWLARPVIATAVGTALDAAIQYKMFGCVVSWKGALASGLLFGVVSQAGPAGPIFGRQYYRGKGVNSLFNSGDKRFGWSWDAKNQRHEFGPHSGARGNAQHDKMVPTSVRDTKGWW